MATKSKCVGRLCDPKSKHLYEGAPEGAKFRYTEKQCERACEEGSNLCKICNKHEQAYMNKPSHFFSGRMGGPLTAESHIVGSKWNVDLRAKEAAKVAAAAGGAGAPAAAKAAAKVAKEAEKEAAAAVRAATMAAKKQATELKKAAAATARAEAAAARAVRASEAPKRKTLKKRKPSSSSSSSSNSSSNSSSSSSNSNSSSSGSRSSSSRGRSRRATSPVIYRPASNQSIGQSAYVQKWAPGTPLNSENMGSANRGTLNRIVANIGLPNLPELE